MMGSPTHTPEPWMAGDRPDPTDPTKTVNTDCIVADHRDQPLSYERVVEHYLHPQLIAESCRVADRDRIIACVNACKGILSKALDAHAIQAVCGQLEAIVAEANKCELVQHGGSLPSWLAARLPDIRAALHRIREGEVTHA